MIRNLFFLKKHHIVMITIGRLRFKPLKVVGVCVRHYKMLLISLRCYCVWLYTHTHTVQWCPNVHLLNNNNQMLTINYLSLCREITVRISYIFFKKWFLIFWKINFYQVESTCCCSYLSYDEIDNQNESSLLNEFGAC